jgi:hypothetical protein
VYIFGACIQLAVIPLLLPIDTHEVRAKLSQGTGPRANWLALGALFALLTFLIGMTIYVTLQKLG